MAISLSSTFAGDMSDADAAPVMADLTKLGQASLDKVAAGGDKDNVFFVSNDSVSKISAECTWVQWKCWRLFDISNVWLIKYKLSLHKHFD